MKNENGFVFKVPPESGHRVLKALGNRMRLRILALIKNQPMSVSEIARTLGISQPTVTNHINQLEDAGLVFHRMQKSSLGYQKVCFTKYDGVAMLWQEAEVGAHEAVYELDMPVGHYSTIDCGAPSFLATQARIIASSEDASKFYNPIRMEAELLVLGNGLLKYLFPYNIPEDQPILSLEVSAELSVAFPENHSRVSLSVALNDQQCRTFEIPRDTEFPPRSTTLDWLPKGLSPWGRLFTWRVNESQALCNSTPAGDFTLSDLHLSPMRPIEVTFQVQSEGWEPNGIVILGKNFGRHTQDIRMKITYQTGKDA